MAPTSRRTAAGFSKRLRRSLPGSKGIAGLRQRHTADVLHLHEDNHEAFLAREYEGDGMATGMPGLWLSISIGDCLPVMIFDPHVPALAMAHAGWGGTPRASSRRRSRGWSRTSDAIPAG